MQNAQKKYQNSMKNVFSESKLLCSLLVELACKAFLRSIGTTEIFPLYHFGRKL